MRKIIGIVLLIILSGLLLWHLDSHENYNRIVQQRELVPINGTLARIPAIESRGRSEWSTVCVRLNEYPGVKFEGIKYSALDVTQFVRMVHAGDSIRLEILRDKYDKLRDDATIEPYSIEANGTSYMSLSGVNEAWKDEQALNRWGFQWFIGMALVVGIIYMVLYLTGVTKKIRGWIGRQP